MEDLVELISLWPSVESRLKMLDIITVWVHTISVVTGCSHRDKESYKNLRQSESRWLNWSCSCSNTMAEDKLGNFLGNVAINGQPGETEPTTDRKYQNLLLILNGKCPSNIAK